MSTIRAKINVRSPGIRTEVKQYFHPNDLTKVTRNKLLKALDDGFAFSSSWRGAGEVLLALARYVGMPRPLIIADHGDWGMKTKSRAYSIDMRDAEPMKALLKPIVDVFNVRMKLAYANGQAEYESQYQGGGKPVKKVQREGVDTRYGTWSFRNAQRADAELFREHVTPALTTTDAWKEGAARIRALLERGEPIEIA